jgi:predicted peroxiredoxin
MTSCRPIKIAALFALATAATALSASPSLAFSQEAQQMCTGDAMRLCGHEVPNVQRITACMVKNKAQLSPGCRAVMDREAAARRRAAAVE